MPDKVPRVSIGLPVYNGENYMAAAIDSLLAQTFTDFELIISDNASTDATEQICRDYAHRDGRIRYYREEVNRGAAWNFTHTFELARGEYFKWHAHDDLCAPTLLERCVEVLDDDASTVLCYARPAVVDDNGALMPDDPVSWHPTRSLEKRCSDSREEPRGLGSASPSRRFYAILLNTIWCLEPYGLIRHRTMAATGKMRGYPLSEKVFLAEMALRGRFFEIPEVLFFPRRHAQQSSLMASATAQRDSMQPRRVKFRWPVPPHVRMTLGYLGASLSAPIGLAERLSCWRVLVRYLFQIRKWKRIVVNTLGDVGLADGFLVKPEKKSRAVSGASPIAIRVAEKQSVSQSLSKAPSTG